MKPTLKIALFFALLNAAFCAAPSHAQQPATRVLAPQIARDAMPKNAISLRWQKLPRGAYRLPLALHVFCVPKGHSKERAMMLAEKKTGPVTRADISGGPSVEPSPFYLDLWAQSDAKNWRRINRISFVETKDVQEIALRWLEPRSKTGPFLALHFGFTHWHEWQTFTFDKGWTQPPYQRVFEWGGESGSGNSVRFDQVENGRMIVVEKEYEYQGDIEKTSESVYRWNGREWLDATQKYFLIAGTFTTRREAQSWYDAKKMNGWGEILRSNDYPKLRPGYFIVVLERFATLQEANSRAAEIRKSAPPYNFQTYVRRAL